MDSPDSFLSINDPKLKMASELFPSWKGKMLDGGLGVRVCAWHMRGPGLSPQDQNKNKMPSWVGAWLMACIYSRAGSASGGDLGDWPG